MNVFRNIIRTFLLAALPAAICAGCVETLEEKSAQYGYLQLKVVKAPETASQTLS